jgi:hypothetical protein
VVGRARVMMIMMLEERLLHVDVDVVAKVAVRLMLRVAPVLLLLMLWVAPVLLLRVAPVLLLRVAMVLLLLLRVAPRTRTVVHQTRPMAIGYSIILRRGHA